MNKGEKVNQLKAQKKVDKVAFKIIKKLVPSVCSFVTKQSFSTHTYIGYVYAAAVLVHPPLSPAWD